MDYKYGYWRKTNIMNLDLLLKTYTPFSEDLYFFSYTNIDEYGYQFLLKPDNINMDFVELRIINPEFKHTDNLGKDYFRIFYIKNKICWTYNYFTTTGESLGRKGIVYIFGIIFDPVYLLKYKNTLLSIFSSFNTELHSTIFGNSEMKGNIDNFVLNLKSETALNILNSCISRIALFETNIKAPNFFYNFKRLNFFFHLFTKHTSKTILYSKDIENKELNIESIFFKEAYKIIRRSVNLSKGISCNFIEFENDLCIRFCPIDFEIDKKSKIKKERINNHWNIILKNN